MAFVIRAFFAKGIKIIHGGGAGFKEGLDDMPITRMRRCLKDQFFVGGIKDPLVAVKAAWVTGDKVAFGAVEHDAVGELMQDQTL